MNIAFIGCGFVAELYAKTLGNHANLKLIGAYDLNPGNLDKFTSRWPVRQYESMDKLLNDSDIEVILNLTNPRNHFEVTRCCLEAGKHVYSEKPLAMTFNDAKTLVRLADRMGKYLASAPSSLLGETAQTMWKAIREGIVGKVRLVYANFDDGMIAPNMSPWEWLNEGGVSWPAKDEFEVGCTYEHCGYVLTWLAAFFGPALRATSFASCQIPDKGISVETMAPDFTVSCINYCDGVVARVTCGLVAPSDKSLTVIGDDGVISTSNVRNEVGPVYVRPIPPRRAYAAIDRRINSLRQSLENCLHSVPWSGREWHFQRKLPLVSNPPNLLVGGGKAVDFCRGPAELVSAISEKRTCRLSAQLAVHLVELIETIQHPAEFSGGRELQSTFESIQPLPRSNLL